MDRLKMHSPNLTQDNIARIRELFPACVTEAKGEDGSVKLGVDFDQLRQELTESVVDGPQERYHLSWPGKREVGCCRFHGHLVKVENETGGGLWERGGNSAGSSSLRP